MPERTIQTESPYIFRVDVPFSDPGVPGEQPDPLYTETPLSVGDSAVEILGMLTNLEGATGLFTLNGVENIWSADQVPLMVHFGKPGSDKPVTWLERPLTISRGQRIRADLVNVDGEGPGTLYFICRQKKDNAPRIVLPEEVGKPDTLLIDSAFTNTADERPARAASPVLDDDFLITDIHTNLNNATVRLFGVDGIPWSEEPLHVWSFAGRASDDRPNRRLHKSYLIPAGNKITAEFVNGSAGFEDPAGQLFFKGIRFPGVHAHA